MKNFRRLEIWRRSKALAIAIIQATKQLPPEERDELGRQMRRSSRSVPGNIAESCGRALSGRSDADMLRILVHASGSLHELDSDCELARDAGYWPPELANPLLQEIAEIRRMLAAFMARRRAWKAQKEKETPERRRLRSDTG